MCRLAGVSCAGYYRHLAVEAPDEAETTIRSVIQEVWPCGVTAVAAIDS